MILRQLAGIAIRRVKKGGLRDKLQQLQFPGSVLNVPLLNAIQESALRIRSVSYPTIEIETAMGVSETDEEAVANMRYGVNVYAIDSNESRELITQIPIYPSKPSHINTYYNCSIITIAIPQNGGDRKSAMK